MKQIIYFIIVIMSIFLIAGCAENKAVPSNEAQVKAISCQVLDVKTYRLPKGALHGYEWDFKKDHGFEMWLVNDRRLEKNFKSYGEEFYIVIPAPDEFINFEEEKHRAEDWNIEVKDEKENSFTYLVGHKQKPISLEITLPVCTAKAKGHCLTVLTNHLGKYMVVFAGGSDYIDDQKYNAIFGYAVITEKQQHAEKAVEKYKRNG
jgi:hypothetical protein